MNSTLARGSIGSVASPSRLPRRDRVRRASFSKSTPPTSTLGRAAFAARTTSSDRRTASFASTRVPSVSSSSGGNRTAALPKSNAGARANPETASTPGSYVPGPTAASTRSSATFPSDVSATRHVMRAKSTWPATRGRRGGEDGEERGGRREPSSATTSPSSAAAAGNRAGALAKSTAAPRPSRGADANARALAASVRSSFPWSSPPRSSFFVDTPFETPFEPSRTVTSVSPRRPPPTAPGSRPVLALANVVAGALGAADDASGRYDPGPTPGPVALSPDSSLKRREDAPSPVSNGSAPGGFRRTSVRVTSSSGLFPGSATPPAPPRAPGARRVTSTGKNDHVGGLGRVARSAASSASRVSHAGPSSSSRAAASSSAASSASAARDAVADSKRRASTRLRRPPRRHRSAASAKIVEGVALRR